MKIHEPVLLEEIVNALNIRKRGKYIDGTLNGGGHARAIIKEGGLVLGIERDPEIAQNIAKERIKNLIVENSNYINMEDIAAQHSWNPVHGIIFDFGMSSFHVDKSGRGFSFMHDEPLDMRYNQNDSVSAAEIINTYTEKTLADLFFAYGEERRSRLIARAIVNERKRGRIATSGHLAEVVAHVVPRHGKVHPATRVFQALRIVVNRELENVQLGLEAAMRLVEPGGRVAAIAFHSLEDRIVKQTFRSSEEGTVITKKPIVSSREEVVKNPRSRSAHLRVWEKHS